MAPVVKQLADLEAQTQFHYLRNYHNAISAWKTNALNQN